jgi:hypothetical protein
MVQSMRQFDPGLLIILRPKTAKRRLSSDKPSQGFPNSFGSKQILPVAIDKFWG